jgi:hypothetical protein
MRNVACPTQSVGDVYAICISRVRNKELRGRLRSVAPKVIAAATSYTTDAATASLHTYPRSNTVGGIVTGKEMIANYTTRMAVKSQPGRGVYDSLISGAPHGRCPLCGVGQVSTLDHHLPKTKYPVLSVTPVNLVPACTWCQTAKKEAYPVVAEDQTLHPYFDNFENERWLGAVVEPTSPATFCFKVVPPNGWSALSVTRLRHHLQVFNLDLLFASNAASELVNIRFALSELQAAGGAAAVQEHLHLEAESREHAFRNSWQTAMYRAAETSDWFCSGGFAAQ